MFTVHYVIAASLSDFPAMAQAEGDNRMPSFTIKTSVALKGISFKVIFTLTSLHFSRETNAYM